MIPGLGISPGGGNGYRLQYSCLVNSMDRGAWQATVHGVTKSWTRLSDAHSRHNLRKIYLFSNKEKRSEREVVVDAERGARDKYGALCHPTLKLHLKSWVSKTDLGQSKGES